MPMKATGPATEYREIDRWDGGVGWIAHPEETMQRASHALAVDGDVWLIDPVDAADLDDLLAEFGEVAGVVVLFERHSRDAGAIAARHDVAVHAPRAAMDAVADLSVPVEPLTGELADTGYVLREIVDLPFWHEEVLSHEDDGVLVVPEAVGTVSYFCTADERLGVHPMLRMVPPQRLRSFSPDRVLCGHGPGVHERAAAALDHAFDGARARTPALYAKSFREFLPV